MALETGFLRSSLGHAEGRRQEAGGRRQKVEVTMKYFCKKPGFFGWCVSPVRVTIEMISLQRIP